MERFNVLLSSFIGGMTLLYSIETLLQTNTVLDAFAIRLVMDVSYIALGAALSSIYRSAADKPCELQNAH